MRQTPPLEFRLCLVTDRSQCGRRPVEDVVAAACRAGVGCVQLREKDLDAKALTGLAARLREITSRTGTKLLINDRVDVALAIGADGVHCPEDGMPPRVARRLLGDSAIVGASAHSLNTALAAHDAGADYVTFGPVFDTPSKRSYGDPQGLTRLRNVTARISTPVIAIGGITAESVASCLEAGAAGVAVIRAIALAEDVEQAAAAFEVVRGQVR